MFAEDDSVVPPIKRSRIGSKFLYSLSPSSIPSSPLSQLQFLISKIFHIQLQFNTRKISIDPYFSLRQALFKAHEQEREKGAPLPH